MSSFQTTVATAIVAITLVACSGPPMPPACSRGATRCGASCTDLSSDLQNCGACAHVCTSPSSDHLAVCTAGACGTVCPPDTASMGTVCAPIAAPRLIAPLSTATVSTRRPALRWSSVSGSDSVRIDLCNDRSLTTQCVSVDAHGGTGTPAMDLSPGVWFWRARWLSAGTVGTETSAVWQFNVGARSASVGTSWGTTLDGNGDGYADLAVGASGQPSGGPSGGVWIHAGGASGVSPDPTLLLPAPPFNFGIGYAVASAGDVNGDGFSDLLVGGSSGYGQAYLYAGGPSGLAETATMFGPDHTFRFGESLSSAGDVNGDGYADIVVGGDVQAYVYLGSAAGLASTPATTIDAPGGNSWGVSVTGACDVNGDGFSDIVVGVREADASAGHADVYFGSASGIDTSAPRTLHPSAGTHGLFGWSMDCAGDVNGDGYPDLIIGANLEDGGRAYVFAGGANGPVDSPAVVLRGGVQAGFSVAGAGDVNGDGYDDVIVGALGEPDVVVFLGSAHGVVTTPSATLSTGSPMTGGWLIAVHGIGDANRDGFDDIAVGAAVRNNSAGTAWVYPGSAMGLVTSGALMLDGLNGPAGGYGASVASIEGDDWRLRRSRRQ